MKISKMAAETPDGSCTVFAQCTARKFCTVNGIFYAQLLVEKFGPVRSGRSRYQFVNTVFSASLLAAINWNGDIMRVSGRKMTTSNL